MERHPNRSRARSPKRGLNWCFGCDMSRVGDGAKCPVCGRVNKQRRERPRRDYRRVEKPQKEE